MKYRNKKVAGIFHESPITFDSQLEAAVYNMLTLRKDTEITACQKSISLTDADIRYIADFECMDTTTMERYYVEAKGMETASWRIKRKLWKVYGPAPLEIWKGTWRKPFLWETLVPKNV